MSRIDGFSENISLDPAGLFRDAFSIKNISKEDCKVIFLNWVVANTSTNSMQSNIISLLEEYGTRFPDHPMTEILKEGSVPGIAPTRRLRRRQVSP